jgi:putative nucleotidyltransferase with HDIG domain
MNKFRQLYIPLLTKITLPYFILALIVVVVGGYVVTRVAVDSAEERFDNQLIETALLANESIVREENELLESLRLVSHLQGIAIAVNEDQIEVLEDLVLPSAFNADVEVLAIVNRFGRELLVVKLNEDSQTYEQLVTTERFANQSFVKNVLTEEQDALGDKFSGLVNSAEESYIFVVGPILDQRGNLVGAALIGKSQSSLARQIRAETLGQISLYSLDGNLQTSTLADTASMSSEQANTVLINQDEGSQMRDLNVDGIHYVELLTPFELRAGEDIGVMGVAQATSFLAQSTQLTRANAALLSVMVLFLVIVVGFFTAQRISSPIVDLKEAAQKVSGGDLSVRVNDSGQDEIGILAGSFNEMLENVNKSKDELLHAYDETIEGWAIAMDLRDSDMQGHSKRVSELAMELAKRMGVSGEELVQLRRGALLHDVGKIAIPDKILLKRDKLTAAERRKINQHPTFGKEFMEQIEFLHSSMDIPYSHHERWDGTGYPQKLSGEDIPLPARIFSVVDVWDAITNDRPYRKAMKLEEAIEIIREGSGTNFDPRVVSEFLLLLEEKHGELAA